MKTIAIVSQKGGSGKTTIATHLAAAADAAGYVTCLIDLDPQATAAAWSDWREQETPEVITAPASRLSKIIEGVADRGAEFVVIDTPPNADAAAREASKAADLILIPCRPRAFDLHAIQTTAEMINLGNKAGFVIFNAAPPRAPTLFAEASALVKQFGLEVVPFMIADRAAFHHTTGTGRTALEDPGTKAAQEISQLWDWTCIQVHMDTRKLVDESGAAA